MANNANNNDSYEWQRKNSNNNNHNNDKSQPQLQHQHHHDHKTSPKRKRIRNSRHLKNKIKNKMIIPSTTEVATLDESLYHTELSDGRYSDSTSSLAMTMMTTTATASSFLTTLLMNSTTLEANNTMAANVLTAIANLGTYLLDNDASADNISNSITPRNRLERQAETKDPEIPYNILGHANNMSFVEAVTAAATNVGNLSNLTATTNISLFTSSAHGGSDTTTTYGIDNGDISFNDSDEMLTENATEYIFDRIDVRIIFITLYTLVFCCCFFGNLLVILVVTLSRRLRSITNFFLANLALADFCVGLFCVMQNLSIYLIDSWVFGEFLCRMYQFVHSLSYTASIFILVVICMERYFAIVHPITCKQILTAARLRMVMLTVWITSAVYSTPKFVFSKTIKNIHNEDGQEEEICVLDRKMFNSQLLDMINFGLLYVIPLLVMTVLYSKIAIALWRSSRGVSHQIAQQQQQHDSNSMKMHNSMYQHHQHLQHHNHQQQQQPPSTPILMASVQGSAALSRKQSSNYEKRAVSISESKVSLESERPIVSACRKTSFYNHTHQHQLQHRYANSPRGAAAHISHSSSNVLRARRGVVRMLIIFVLTFALCNLPYHARKMWQYWSRSYRGDSNFNALLTPLTFLVTYFNSGVNPLLYAFLSRNFRKGMKELLLCSWKKGKGKSSSNSSMHHKRVAVQTHSIPTDTTHIGNEQV